MQAKTRYNVNLPIVCSCQNYDYRAWLLFVCKAKGMLDQKWKWIAVLIDCASDISVSVEKFKLN